MLLCCWADGKKEQTKYENRKQINKRKKRKKKSGNNEKEMFCVRDRVSVL